MKKKSLKEIELLKLHALAMNRIVGGITDDDEDDLEEDEDGIKNDGTTGGTTTPSRLPTSK